MTKLLTVTFIATALLVTSAKSLTISWSDTHVTAITTSCNVSLHRCMSAIANILELVVVPTGQHEFILGELKRAIDGERTCIFKGAIKKLPVAKISRNRELLAIIRRRLVDASDDLTCKGVDAVFKADLEDRLNATQALLDAKSAELNRITLHGQHPNIGHGGKHSGSIGMQPDATGTIRWRGQVLVAGAALFALGYGIALVSKPTITPAKGVPVLQPKRGFGIASSVSGAIAGGVALKAFQSASALAASQSMSSGRPADAPNFALVRSSTNCIIAYVLAGTFAVLLTGLVVSMARLKRRLKRALSTRDSNYIMW